MTETISAILDIIASIKNISTLSGGELSEKALKLSIHKVYVGQRLATLEYKLANNKMVRKTAWGNAYSEAEGTVDARKIQADVQVDKMTKAEIELERKIGILKNLRFDVSDVISTIQSRLSQLRNEMIESK